jgi:parallel beta-helix repeat protein
MFLAAAFLVVMLPTSFLAQTFRPSSYQAGSKTAGIQEAIDAAAKAGGGTVQIAGGTFVLHALPGHPAILLRSGVNIIGTGPDSTILKLEANPKVSPAVMTNQSYANPDAGEPDHDITLTGFTIDVAASDQVLRETQLVNTIPLSGLQEIALQAAEGLGVDSMLRVDPGPNEEIVPILAASPGHLKAFLMHPHSAGAKVVVLLDRLHGIALVGAHNVTIEDVTIQNASMDGIYLASTISPTLYHTYCQRISIQHSNFTRCHRNGISVIDADDVMIADNTFSDITGDPGAPVDIEPNHPEQHGSHIVIRDNQSARCYRGMTLALANSGPTSENFKGEVVTGNKISATLYGWALYVGMQRAGAKISGNTISDPAGDGILVVGSSGLSITNNEIINTGRCHVDSNCPRSASGYGIRILDDTNHGARVSSSGNTISGNLIKDEQQASTLLYGIEFLTSGTGNSIQGNKVSRFDPAHGMVVHAGGNAAENAIANNVRQ